VKLKVKSKTSKKFKKVISGNPGNVDLKLFYAIFRS